MHQQVNLLQRRLGESHRAIAASTVALATGLFVCGLVGTWGYGSWEVSRLAHAVEAMHVRQQTQLSQELTQVQADIRATADLMDASGVSDATRGAASRLQALQSRLDAVTRQFASAGAGLIPPERMTQVIRDVLSRSQGLKLISLRSAPARSLLPAADPNDAETAPYVHPVELVVEGSYVDVLGYLKSLEALPWSFYWNTLELTTLAYPQNRIRIELITLSMDKAWLGV